MYLKFLDDIETKIISNNFYFSINVEMPSAFVIGGNTFHSLYVRFICYLVMSFHISLLFLD